jgi:iron-sulfur cluster assembly accessory protein
MTFMHCNPPPVSGLAAGVPQMSEAISVDPATTGAPPAAAPFTVSDRAARRVGEILKGEPAGSMLRVSVEGGGCSGFQYKFDFDRNRADDDLVIEKLGATVLIDSVSVQYVAGSELDFVEDLIGSAFKIKNPNATASCGCGTSFSL